MSLPSIFVWISSISGHEVIHISLILTCLRSRIVTDVQDLWANMFSLFIYKIGTFLGQLQATDSVRA